ncbi:MAG: histidine kinase, partial [Owenweeksia sp.]
KNGFIVFHPDEIITASVSANVAVNSLKIEGQERINELLTASGLVLDHHQNRVDLRFCLFDFSHPLRNIYRYKLEPFDEQWRQTDGRYPMVTYTNLPPGEYSFKLEASVNGINWINSNSRISFLIKPAIWQNWWFWPLVIMVCMAGVSGWLYSRFRKKLRIEREKYEISQRLASLEIRALQSQMNPHFIFNAIHSVQHFMFQGNLLEANNYLTRFATLMRFFMEASIQKRVRLNDEMKMIRLYVELEMLRFDACFDFEISYPGNKESDISEIPSMFIQPYVENAIQHGLANKKGRGHLKLEVKDMPGYLKITIDDNGIGREQASKLRNTFNEERKSRGMQLLKERAEIHNNSALDQISIEVKDKIDENGEPAGTRVILMFFEKEQP